MACQICNGIILKALLDQEGFINASSSLSKYIVFNCDLSNSDLRISTSETIEKVDKIHHFSNWKNDDIFSYKSYKGL